MANRLAGATSPYLQQHAENPVDWWPWTAEAFAEARRRDVPVLISVGYAACHWCHVMAHESFEDSAVAAVVNEFTVPIKVDREERPDVDAVYMTATQAMTGHGGWPMTVFATPDGEPFHCGTYYPREAFAGLVRAVADAWRDQRGAVLRQGGAVVEAIGRASAGASEASGGALRQKIAIQQGIPIEKAREIVRLVKDSKVRVQAAIQEDQVRVSGKNRDDLQKIIAMVKEKDFGIALQFTNYRNT